MTYRLNSNVPLIYNPYDIRQHRQDILPPFKQRKEKVVYLNSNCGALNNRNEKVRSMMKAGVEVAAIGSCLRNTQRPLSGNKQNWFQKYRVCIGNFYAFIN